MPIYVALVFAFIISFITVPMLISLAHSFGAVALPGKRHIHSQPTPKFGGVAIAFTVLLISPFIFSIDKRVGAYLLSSTVILLLGIVDDIRGTSWRLKLAFSLIATLIFILCSDVWIDHLGNLFGLGDVYLGLWGIPFTLFAVFGVVNAINLIDGLNGLACGISAITFISFAVFASMSGNETVFYLSLINLGATLGFFRHNYPRAKIFMGDSGSLLLGFSLAILAIFLTQGEGTVNPMVPVLILIVPIFDAIRVLVIRIKNKKHPMAADKTHLHHLMLRSGIHNRRVVKTIWILSAAASFLAFLLFKYDSWVLLAFFCAASVAFGIFIKNLRVIKLIVARKKKSSCSGGRFSQRPRRS